MNWIEHNAKDLYRSGKRLLLKRLMEQQIGTGNIILVFIYYE